MAPLEEATRMSFAIRMRDLEREFAATAVADGDVYLPNFTPAGPVDAVLIAMEPSLTGWARSPSVGAQRITAGLRNFMWSPEAMILHYAARRFLCSGGESYHVTDIAKGAMCVRKASIDRDARYKRWAVLLKKEVQLVAKPSAQIIAIGGKVYEFLEDNGLDRGLTSIMHYSGQAGAARNTAVRRLRLEAEFSAFSERFSMQDLVDVASEIMQENSVPVAMSEETIARLRRVGELSPSRKKLAFIYSTAFAKLKAQRS
jgi:hypothetical protein